MTSNKKHLFGLSIILTLFFFACSSEENTSAKLYLQQQEWEKAEEFLIKAMAVEPDNPEIPFRLGHDIYARKGDWEKMDEVFKKAMAIDPERPILQGQPVKEYVEISRKQHWTDVYNQGVNYFNKSREMTGDERIAMLQKAIDAFLKATIIKSDESQAYALLATCYYQIGEKQKSGEMIEQAVQRNPEDATINYTAGQIFLQLDDLDRAFPYFLKAVELDSHNAKAIRSLAQAYYDLGNTAESIRTYETAIREETDYKVRADLYFNLGILYDKVGNFEMAEENFLNALDLNPEDQEAILGMAQTFEKSEKWRKAEKFYKELISLDPENPIYYRGMARVQMKQGNPDEAQYYFRKAKKLEN
jgi:tetratricopeptide (TPR) repeat protein